ncbi:protein SOGA1-like [Xyrauchen texanus]|uniref:protein SOGA1-like n=1 Tax=Xyrauchen texanus TaxID=154827 RepID=UPI002241B19B|nr:protein SOGA1-like [Xyrauchen texanus]
MLNNERQIGENLSSLIGLSSLSAKMTKTKLEVNPASYARSSHHGQDGEDKDCGDESSHQQSRQIHRRHVQQMTSKDPQTNAFSKSISGHSHSKKSKRGSSGTANIQSAPNGGHKEMKPESRKRPEKAHQSPCQRNRRNKSSGRRKISDASITSDDLSKDSGCATGKQSSTDSSSEVSDATNEHKQPANAQFVEPEVSHRGIDEERMDDSTGQISDHRDEIGVINATLSPVLGFGEGSISPGDQRSYASFDSRLNFSASAFSDLTGDFDDGVHEDLLREIDDLRSENVYLKDEMEELHSEMLEMRDMYMEDDVYQLQELRQQLEQANKACRILQYRLRKAERRSIRVAQTGQVDGELIRTLEHDIRVAKSVSLRLHSELESIQKKNSRLEWENEELRERLQDLEVAKQVLQAEMDKSRENSLKRRSLRSMSSKSEKKLSPQDDRADLKCQLHFAKEESALMCKKLTKMAMESETMREELAKYRLLYGEVDETQAAAGSSNSTHTREAEAKVHLRLVEEEATLLSRRIVELEVENRGLRAEMSELQERGGSLVEEELMKVPGEGLGEQGEMEHALRGGNLEKAEEMNTHTNIHVNQTHSEEGRSENSSISHMHREGLIGGDSDQPVEQELSTQSREEVGKAKSGCSLRVKDLEGLLAIRDQALLVRSTIQFLTCPVKNGLSPTYTHKTPPGAPYLSKTEVDPQCKTHQWLLDPMLSPLTNGLEVLQAQLRALVEQLEVVTSSTSERPAPDLEKTLNCGIEEKDTKDQSKQECPDEGNTVNLRIPLENEGYNQDSLLLLTLQFQWFLQRWRHGERPTEDGKNLFEMYCQNDPYILMDTESQRCKYNPQDKCNSQVSSALLSDLRAALQDLLSELCEEHRAAQYVIWQFANAKAAWAVECAELKSLISRLEGPAGKVGVKGQSDLNIALQKDHIEKLQHLLAESYAAVMDLTRQLKTRENTWSSERQELIEHLNRMRLQCKGSKRAKHNGKMQFPGFKMMEKDGIKERTAVKTGTAKSNKNWMYLSREAALLDREEPCKTWDYPVMPPSFPGLKLNQSMQRSHTAPERTSIRIYYSPPSSKRIQLSSVIGQEKEECEESQEPHFNAVSSGLVNQDWVTAYENCQVSLPFDCQSLIERDSMAVISSTSSSAVQTSGITSPSRLALNTLDISANLSDDMKEITASVLQTSQSMEGKRARDSGSSVLRVSTGTQTCALPQVTTVGLQTDGPRSLYTAKHWSPRVTSFVSARTPQTSTSLDRVPGSTDRLQPLTTSPKIQRRHSASSPSSSSSSTSSSSSSFTTSSLSSSSSLSFSSRLEYGTKEHGPWGLSPRGSPSSAWARSTTSRPSSVSVQASDKPGSRKNVGIHKYGLVQEFLRNVCGRGEKTNTEVEKAPKARRDHIGLVGSKKSEHPPSRIPAVPLVRNDSITKIVNRRFIKQGQKEEGVCSQSQTQTQIQINRSLISKNKSLEDGACDCSSRSLTSCFARPSNKNLRHVHRQRKPQPQECHSVGVKGDPLAQ